MSDEAYDPTSTAGVPEHGRERLARLREQPRFFTSDLTVNEFLLIQEAGFEPLGLVVGSSIYHIGLQTRSWKQNQELDVLTQAMYHARELAMTRMEEEADQLGADGIVGVRLEIGRHEWGRTSPSSSRSGRPCGTARDDCTALPTAGRSRATSRGRTSGHSSPPATGPSGSSWATASITSRIKGSAAG